VLRETKSLLTVEGSSREDADRFRLSLFNSVCFGSAAPLGTCLIIRPLRANVPRALKSRSRFVQAAVSAGEYTTKKFSHSLQE
jgi:hypothetical protein